MGLVAADILPPFSTTIRNVGTLIMEGELQRHVALSLVRQTAGLVLGVVGGVTLGVFMAWSRGVRAFFEPLLMLTNPIPKAALIPLFMLWFGIGTFSKVMLIFVGTIIPVVISSFHAVADVSRNHLWSARAMGDGTTRMLLRVVLPAASPQVLTGIRLGLIVSLIVLVGSEMLAGREGLRGLPPRELPSLGSAMRRSASFLVPLSVLVIFLFIISIYNTYRLMNTGIERHFYLIYLFNARFF